MDTVLESVLDIYRSIPNPASSLPKKGFGRYPKINELMKAFEDNAILAR